MSKFIEVQENVNEINQIAEATFKTLADEFAIKFPDANPLPTVVYVFLKEAAKVLSEQKEEGSEVSLNLFHMLEMGISHEEVEGEKDGNFTPFAIPGQEFKLMVKSDDSTEE